MSWRDQGRQQHMWFGHGTASGGDAALDDATLADHMRALAMGALAMLPANLRPRAEAQYQSGTLTRLAEAMGAWMRGRNLPPASFAERFFGRDATDPVAQNLHSAVLRAGAATGKADFQAAAGHVADAIQTIGTDRFPRFVAAAQARARDGAPVAKVATAPDPAQTLREKNLHDLATIIESEAGGNGKDAKTAVGATVINRMRRNNAAAVGDVMHSYAHKSVPKPESEKLAKGLMDGTIKDPTDGSTHFYTPSGMPKKGEDPGKHDVKGGLESVPGVESDDGQPVRNFRPGWATSPDFEQKPVTSVPEKDFKFYRQKGNGHVQ